MSWKGYDMLKGSPSEDFKQYLRDRNLYFEPSSNGDLIHFEVKNADEYVDLEVKSIKKHYSNLKDSKVRLIDAGLSDIKKELAKLIEKCNSMGVVPTKVPLKVRFIRGNLKMDNGEWSKNPEGAKNLTLNINKIDQYFTEKNLNMGVLGYGDTSKGLKELLKWVEHNISIEKLKGEQRDINMRVNKCVLLGSKRSTKTNPLRAVLVVEVPDKKVKGDEEQDTLKILKENGYIPVKEFITKALDDIKYDDEELSEYLTKYFKENLKLDNVIETQGDDDND
jgi:hypothetical protein